MQSCNGMKVWTASLWEKLKDNRLKVIRDEINDGYVTTLASQKWFEAPLKD
jgi:hypothetical protein